MSDFDRLARYYDLEHADYRQDLAIYAGFAGFAAGDTQGSGGVLELGCGTGRCLVPLAASGAYVTGLDISPAMLALARANAEAAGVSERVRLVPGDMRSFTLDRAYGLIFIALNSLMHVQTQEDQRRVIDCAGRHLAPDGRLVLDLFNPDVALPDAEQEGQLFLHCLKVLPSGAHLLHFQSPRVDRANQIISMANYYDELSPDGAVKRYLAPFTLRYLTRAELELLIVAAGLHLEAFYGSYDLDPFETGSPQLIAVTRRPRDT